MKIYRLANDAPRPGPTPIIKKMKIFIKIQLILVFVPITTAMGFFCCHIFLVHCKNIYLKITVFRGVYKLLKKSALSCRHHDVCTSVLLHCKRL